MLPLLVPEAQFKRVEYVLWTTTKTTTMTIEKKKSTTDKERKLPYFGGDGMSSRKL